MDYCTLLKNAQKADLHNHLTLGVKPETLIAHFPNAKLRIPKRYLGLPGMMRFIHKHVNTIMRDRESTIKFMELAIEDSIRDNVILLEASVDVKLKKYFNNSVYELIDIVVALQGKYKDRIAFRPDVGIDKGIDYKAYKDSIYACINSGIFNGIDLYGIEKNRKLNHFSPLFMYAKKSGVKTKVHIGEFSSNDTIEDAIAVLDPDVIQHGIRAIKSEKTIRIIKSKNITLNICPQSNIALMSVWSLKTHPVKKLFDCGINVTVNTDDLLLFNSTVSDQYIALVKSGVFTYEQVEQIRLKSLSGFRLTTAST